MSTLADNTITALRSNHEDLAARVRGLDDEDLARQSACSEWEIAQVLGHLGSGAEIGLAGLLAGIAGEEPPGQDFNQSVWDRWNALGRQESAKGFRRANEELVSAFEGLDGAARSELRVKLGFLPFPADAAVLSGMRLNEAALHSWDVRVAFDPHATLTGQEAAIAIDQLGGPLSFLLGFFSRGKSEGASEATLRVEITDPDHVFHLVIGESVALGDAAADPNGVLTGPAEAFVRLLSGRLDTAHTPGTLTVTGGAMTLDQLRVIFPGF